jgi:hypothetical protein
MNESLFWRMIEDAWAETSEGGWVDERRALAEGAIDDDGLNDLAEAMDDMIPALRTALHSLTKEELLTFDRILERKLYDIDRAEIQECTDGSDDGFLYARGFIVAMGIGYYEAVNALPSLAVMDVECEDMCYLSTWVYEQKFGDMPRSDISRETASNLAGWPELG